MRYANESFPQGELFIVLQELIPKLDLMAYRQAFEKRKLAPRRMKPIKPRASRRGTHHYTPIHKLGFPAGVRCWCGDELTFRYGEYGIMQRRKEWFDLHDECEPQRGDDE